MGALPVHPPTAAFPPALQFAMTLPLLDTTSEFRAAGTCWYLDARLPQKAAIVTHAHSDHLGRHQRVVATPVTCDLLRPSIGR